MRENLLEIVQFDGTTTIYNEPESIQQFYATHSGSFLRIGQKKLSRYNSHSDQGHDDVLEPYRFVFAKNQSQMQILLNVSPFQIHLHDSKLKTEVVEANPYISVRWLKNKIEKQRNTHVSLLVNEQELTILYESLVKYKNVNIHIREKGTEEVPKQQQKNSNQEHQPLGTPVVEVNVGKQLEDGRLLIKQTDYYKDAQGCIHKHNQQKTISKGGEEKVLDVDYKQNKQGNIVNITQVLTQTKKDPQTGQTIKTQTDVIENERHEKTIIKKSQVIDSTGHILKAQTQIFKSENDKRLGSVENSPVKVETDTFERKVDQHGNLFGHTKDVKEQHGVTTVVEKHIICNKQGAVIQQKSDVTKIQKDDKGNVHKHQHNQIDDQNKKVIIDEDTVIDKDGKIISKETDIKTIQATSNKNIHQHETNIIEGGQGKTLVIEKDTIEDQKGNILKSNVHMHQAFKEEQKPQPVISPEKEQLIKGGKEVTIDESGNIHTHEKELLQKQGITTFVDKDTVSNTEGKVIKIQTNIVSIQGDNQGNMHRHKTQLVQQDRKVLKVQTDVIMNQDGDLLRQQKDTVQIDCKKDGSLTRHEKDVIQQDGNTKIIEKDVVKDLQGHIVHSETKITEIKDNKNTMTVLTIDGVEGHSSEKHGKKQVNKTVQLITDQQGNTLTKQKQVAQDQYGRQTIVYRDTLQNKEGQLIKGKTQMVHVCEESNKPQIHRHIVNYEEEKNKVIIKQSSSKQNLDGSIIKSQNQTIEIEKCQDGTIHMKNIDIIEKDGKTIVHRVSTIEDQAGKLLRQNQNISETSQGITVQKKQGKIQRQQIVDKEGNIHVIQTETQVKNEGNEQKIISRQFISNPKGQLIKTQTGIIEMQQKKDGSSRLTSTDIIQAGHNITITQSDSVEDPQGKQIRNESGILKIQDIGHGVTKKQEEKVIVEGDSTVKVEKSKFEDQEGHVIQENVKTSQVTIHYDQQNKKIQNIKQLATQITKDSHGHQHYKQKQIIDKMQGKTTIIQTEVFRDQHGNIIKATTDVTEKIKQQDGTVKKNETNIIEIPNKFEIAESNSTQNKQGEKINTIQSIQVTKGENGQIIQSEVGITTEDTTKTIIKKSIIEDAKGNVVKIQTRKQTIYSDDQGKQKGRDIETYQVKQDKMGVQPLTIEKQVKIDIDGNKTKVQRQTVDEGNDQKKIVQTITKQNVQGNLMSVETNLLQIEKRQSGTQMIHQTNIIEDDKKLTVIQNKSVANKQGQILSLKTEIVELQPDEHGNTKRTETNVVEQAGQTIITEKKAIKTEDGSLINESLNVTKILQKEDGKIQIIENYQPLESEIQGHQKKSEKEQTKQQQKEEKQVEMKSLHEIDKQGKEKKEVKKERENKQNIGHIQKQHEVIEDSEGNLHTFDREVIQHADGQRVLKFETVQNPEGKVIQKMTNIVDTKQQQDGKSIMHSTDILEGDKLVITQVVTIQNPDGSVINEQSKKVQIQEKEGLIKTNTVNVIHQGGKTTVHGVKTLQDEHGNIIDKSQNSLKIDETKQAVQQQAEKIVEAQMKGVVKGVTTTYSQDSLGNKHCKQIQQIQDHGKKITVDHQTIQNKQGKVIRVQTQITSQKQLQSGKVQKIQTEIIEEEGNTVKVMEFSEIKNSQEVPKQKEEDKPKQENIGASKQNQTEQENIGGPKQNQAEQEEKKE